MDYNNHTKIKLGLVSSKGGHLYQMMQIKLCWKKYQRFWVTFKGLDSSGYLKHETVYYAFFPESRNIVNLIRNFFLALRILREERPTHLLSSGAAIAVPFFIVGKYLFKTRLIFIEPYDFIKYPSLTGKILYNMVDCFIIQHQRQKQWYPKAIYIGGLL